MAVMKDEIKQDTEDNAIKLETTGDLYRALARLEQRVRAHHVDPLRARVLKEIYAEMLQVKRDIRDNLYKKQLSLLWKEYQSKLKGARLPANTDSSVIDITPTEQINQELPINSDSNESDSSSNK